LQTLFSIVFWENSYKSTALFSSSWVNPIELGVASQLKANKIDRVTFQNLAAIRLSYQKKVKAMKSTKRGSHEASEHLTFLALSRALHHFATSLICWSKFTNLLRVVTLASFLV